MSILKYEDINNFELDILKELGSIGTGNAATALSGVLSKKVKMSLPEVKIMDFNKAIYEFGGPETVVAGVLVNFSGEIKGMMPKLHSDNFDNMELIRPLYLVREKDIKAWVKYNDLKFLNCACRFTEKNNDVDNQNSKRLEIKKLIEGLEKESKFIPYNIFRSTENVNLDMMRAYKTKGKKHNFLDTYDERR